MVSALCVGSACAADEKPVKPTKPAKRTDKIRVYNTKIVKKNYYYPEVQKDWEDISPAKYDVWHQPYKKMPLDVNTAFVVEAYVKDTSLPFPAVGRRGVRVVFPACGDGPFVYIYTPAKGNADRKSWEWWGMACGEVYLVTPWGPYKKLDGTINPKGRLWLSGTYNKEFKYKLVKTKDGRDKLIVHHVTCGVNWHQDERRMVVWEVVLGDWFATVKLPEKCDVKWVGSHSHWRIQAVPGKTEQDKGVIMDVKFVSRSEFPVDLKKQRRFVQMHLQMYGTQWYKPGEGRGHLPFVWWEKTGSGKGWVYTQPGTGPERRYQCVGRAEAMTAGLIRVGGLPIHQLDLLRADTKIPKTLPPGRYRRMALVEGKNWKTDQTIKVDKNNQGKDVPAKVAGSEYLYLVDDLEERWFKPSVSAQEKLKIKPDKGDDKWVVSEGVMVLKHVKSPPPTMPAPTADAAAPKHWGYYKGGGSAVWGRTANEAHSGKFSAFLRPLGRGDINVALIAGDSNGYIGEKASPAKASAKYKYSFWAKGDLKDIAIRLVAWKTDKADNYKDRIPHPAVVTFSPTPEWKKYEGEFTMPAEAKKFVLMFQRSGTIGLDEPLGTLYIDDLSVRTDEAEVIKNGGAENK